MSEGCQLFCQVALESGYTKFWCSAHHWATARWPFPSKMVNCGATAVEDQHRAAAAIDVQSLKLRHCSGVCVVHLRSRKIHEHSIFCRICWRKKYFHSKTLTMLKLNKGATEKGISTCWKSDHPGFCGNVAKAHGYKTAAGAIGHQICSLVLWAAPRTLGEVSPPMWKVSGQ